ncbi:MAG: hypothetical protein IJM08_01645 [Firmicutes bacterium]|nr:hypothetical protein [Bacillota bacterium]
MKTIETNGCYLEPIPFSGPEWYYGTDYNYGDLYEAEEIVKAGNDISGRELCLVRYPDGTVFRPVPKERNVYPSEPVYSEGGIYILTAYFDEAKLRVLRFDCENCDTEIFLELPLDSVKDCYNLRLDPAPLTITRQSVADNEFEIIWPEKIRLEMGSHDSFFLRQGDRLYFNRWYEEGSGQDYRYWEETIVRGLDGEVLEVIPGDVKLMPDGELWYLK